MTVEPGVQLTVGVEMAHPLKQGLKLLTRNVSLRPLLVEMAHPLKQGLKL